MAGASGDCYSAAFCTINTLSLVLLLLLLYRYFFSSKGVANMYGVQNQ